ncbi:hypothetical protein Tco_0199945 [Tanacetum coccineum]
MGAYRKVLRRTQIQSGSGSSIYVTRGGIFAYEAERCRQQFASFMIQEGLSFNHFDNPRLSRVIQNTLQPRYTKVSRSTLKCDCMKAWKKAKTELIKGFDNLNSSVKLTTDVWSAPHGLPDSYLYVTVHWVDPVTWQMMKHAIAFENFNLEDVLEYEQKLHETEVATDEAYSIFDEEIALDEAASEARSSEAEEEYVNLEQALN